MAGIGKPTIELQKLSSAHNACSWIAIASHEGLEIKWGVVGTNGNRKFIRISDCRKNNPALELQERMKKKLSGAYTLKSFDDVL